MSSQPPLTSSVAAHAHHHRVRRVLWVVLGLNAAVSLLKIGLGVITGALAVVADGFHSLVDASSNLVGLAALRFASRPADEEHPYGYQRYETLGALAIGVLMFVSAWEIGREVVARLGRGELASVSPWAVYGMLVAFPVHLFVAWWEARQGRALKSEILLADAAHTRADLLITGAVIAALMGGRWGFPWLDPVAALGVVFFIVRAAWGIVGEAARYLTDARVADPQAIEAVALQVPGVQYVHRIRSRGKPGAAFVDLHVKVPPGMSTDHAHAVATEVERQIRERVPGVTEAIVHIEPARHAQGPSPWEETFLHLRRLADGLGLGVHELHLHPRPDGGVLAEMHLEFAQRLTLGEAYRLAQAFRRRAQAEMPHLDPMVLHLEPLAAQMQAAAPPPEGMAQRLEALIREAIAPAGRLEAVTLYRVAGHLHAAIQVALPAAWSLERAHQVADGLQREVLGRFSALGHVTVEVRPREAASSDRPEGQG